MRKILTILALIASFSAQASHILGGMLVVSQTSQDSTSIGAYFIMDQQGIIPPKQYVSQYELVNGFYNYTGSVELSNPITSIHQGAYLVQYSSDYLDLDSNKYRFVASHCCWGFLNNSSNSWTSDLVISVDYWHIPNNSTPYMENPMWINMQKDSVNTMKPIWGVFNCFFSQMEFDSVNFYQGELYSGYANGVFVPQVQSPSNMIVNNDSICFVSSTLGRVGNGFIIDEYRNGQLIGTQRIQWTFNVLISTLSVEELEFRSFNYAYIYNLNGELIYQGNEIPWRELNGMYIIVRNGTSEKVFIQ